MHDSFGRHVVFYNASSHDFEQQIIRKRVISSKEFFQSRIYRSCRAGRENNYHVPHLADGIISGFVTTNNNKYYCSFEILAHKQ